MVKKPFFSIVIPTYNRASDLQFTLFCILRQNFSDFEIVISDNCSTDDTKVLISKLNDKRINYSRTVKNLGNALNIKRAIKKAKGEYVFIHSDDDFLPYANSLQEIYKKVSNYKPGYVRVNYFSLSLDKKRIFSYKIKPFVRDEYLPPFLENKKILSFILESDPYFMTGIIFKNKMPSNIRIVDTDPVPGIDILFYAIENFGAYFITKPYIIACWSRRKIDNNAEHHFFTLISGKLRCENYLNAVKRKVSSEVYNAFLHTELMHLYVRLFPTIKLNVGNKKMLQISERICLLDPTMKKSIIYWVYFISALILPRTLLILVRDIYLHLYARFYKVNNNKEIVNTLKDLGVEFVGARENVLKIKEPIFNFD